METTDQKSRFFDFLLESNKPYLENLGKWVFHPGMLFNSWEKWWGDQKARSAAHQGIDLCFFEDVAGQIHNVNINLKIPCPFKGEIVKIEKDFLGESIYLRHHILSGGRKQLYTAFGHTTPVPTCRVGEKVAAGEVLAQIAPVPQKARILPHLHITFAWIPVSFNLEGLNWENLAAHRKITLIDPLAVLANPGGSQGQYYVLPGLSVHHQP
jgi:hypothetical protein